MRTLLFACLLVVAVPAFANLKITINRGVESALPIAVVPFKVEGGKDLPQKVSRIVSHDLEGSGMFKTLPVEDMLAQPHTTSNIDYRNWRAVDVGNVVVGHIKKTPAGGYQVYFQLADIYNQKQIAGYRITVNSTGLRTAAHRVSDLVYETLIGEPGAFSTKIAYISVSGSPPDRTFRLIVADQDGYDPTTLARQDAPLLSPAWSPDGSKIAYVSLADAQPSIFIQDTATGQARKVASKPGVNSAPAWSPDGKKLALTLSLDGNLDLYILNLSNGKLTQVTNSWAIDTEPNWSPDGESLVFTSDRGGSAQIYRVSTSGGKARRLTFRGKSNQGATFSPDGHDLALVHQDEHGYRIAIKDLDTGRLRIVSKGPLDEKPSFSPNGNMLIYGTRNSAKGGALAEVTLSNGASVRLSAKGDVREPVWSPFLQ